MGLNVQALPLEEKVKLHLADTHTPFIVHDVRWITRENDEPFWGVTLEVHGQVRSTTFGVQEQRDTILLALQDACKNGPVTGVALMSVETKQGRAFVFTLADLEEDMDHATGSKSLGG